MTRRDEKLTTYTLAISVILLVIVAFAVRAYGQQPAWRSVGQPLQHTSSTVLVGNEVGGGVSYWGVGSIVDIDAKRAIVVSVWHIYRDEGVRRPIVKTADGHRWGADVLALDVEKDLVVLAIRPPPGATAMPVSSSAPIPGVRVKMCSLRAGQMTERSIIVHGYKGTDLLVDNVAIPGDSGSAVVAADGSLVGVVWGTDFYGGPTRCVSIGPIRKLLMRTRFRRRPVCLPPGCGPPEPVYVPATTYAPQQPPAGIPLPPGSIQAPMSDQPTLAGQDNPVPTPNPTVLLDEIQQSLDAIANQNADMLERLAALEARPPPTIEPGRYVTPTDLQQFVDDRPIRVEIYDTNGELIDETTVSLGGKLRLQLYERGQNANTN